MKRLLCIVGSMNAGGAETFLMKMYRQLDRTQYQMDFAVAVTEEGFYDKEIISMGGNIYHITPKSYGFVRNFLSIRKLVKEKQYKYVLRTSQHSLSALELFAAKLGGAPVRVFRSSNSNTTTGNKKELVLHRICLFMPKHFANVRIAPSTEAAEFMFGKNCVSNGKAFLLHNAVDTSVYHYDDSDRKAIRKELGIKDKDYVVGHVGRFNQQKNHKFLIEVFAEILKQKTDARLVLVGVGELKNTVEKQVNELCIAKNVVFTGVRHDVPKLLSAFDVFLFPSLYEGMPNTVIEAQATGLPCVIADTITREANITGLVVYHSLSENTTNWARTVSVLSRMNDVDINGIFNSKGYDIRAASNDFVKLIYEGGHRA